MEINNNITFGSTYKFLQNQRGLNCACCGKLILSEKDVTDIYKSLQGQKGSNVAKILSPYASMLEGKSQRFLNTIINCANEKKFQNWNFKQLSMLGKEPNIYSSDAKMTLNNLLKSIKFSVEHTNPRSNNGINHYTNYLPMHIGCNIDRGSESYELISKKNPEFIQNLRNSILQIKSRILSDKEGKTHFGIKLQEDYVEGIIKNIIAQGIDKKFFADILSCVV